MGCLYTRQLTHVTLMFAMFLCDQSKSEPSMRIAAINKTAAYVFVAILYATHGRSLARNGTCGTLRRSHKLNVYVDAVTLFYQIAA